jgi:hypothetical protein
MSSGIVAILAFFRNRGGAGSVQLSVRLIGRIRRIGLIL